MQGSAKEASKESDDGPGRGGRISREKLDKLLQSYDNAPEFWNDRLLFALKKGQINETQYRCSSATGEHCVKRYLWSLTNNDVIRKRLRA